MIDAKHKILDMMPATHKHREDMNEYARRGYLLIYETMLKHIDHSNKSSKEREKQNRNNMKLE